MLIIKGVLVVAAAGNNGTSDGSGDTVNYPARYSSVIAVSAVDSNDRRASFSTTGSTIEVAGPGVSVLSTYLGNQYAQMSGTSMAAPYVAGNLALLKQAYINSTHIELRDKLQESVVDLGETGKDNWFGYGLIQAPEPTQEETLNNDSESQDPIEEVEQIVKTVTNVSTDQSSYLIGEKVNITTRVYDETGNAQSGAEVSITITPPRGKVLSGRGTTNQYGMVTFVMSTKRNTAKGTYHIKTDATLNHHEGSSAVTSFQIR